MRDLFNFIKRTLWLRLVFFFVLFALLGAVLSFFYNLVGNLYFGYGAKIFTTLVFGLVLMVFIKSVRRLFRIHSNLKLFYTVLGALIVIHFFRWSFHVTWLRSFDWTVDGLHPLFDFVGFMDYFWYIVTEGRLPGMHLAPNMFRFNDVGWLLTVYDFELQLRGTLLALVWTVEFVVISGMAVLGVFMLKETYLYNHYTWAIFERLPYPFEIFTDKDLKGIEEGELELITERTFAEGNVFSQVALVYAGKAKTEYIAVFLAKLGKKGKVTYGPPSRVIPVGVEEIGKIEMSLKETHATFFDKKDSTAENPSIELVKKIAKKSSKKEANVSEPKEDKNLVAKRGIAFSEKSELVDGFRPIKRNVKERRQPNGTYKLP